MSLVDDESSSLVFDVSSQQNVWRRDDNSHNSVSTSHSDVSECPIVRVIQLTAN